MATSRSTAAVAATTSFRSSSDERIREIREVLPSCSLLPANQRRHTDFWIGRCHHSAMFSKGERKVFDVAAMADVSLGVTF